MPKICQGMPKICPWYAPNMLKICWDMHEITWGMPEIWPRYSQDMLKICLRFAQDMPEICPIYAWVMHEVCRWYARDMPRIWHQWWKHKALEETQLWQHLLGHNYSDKCLRLLKANLFRVYIVVQVIWGVVSVPIIIIVIIIIYNIIIVVVIIVSIIIIAGVCDYRVSLYGD